MADTCTPTTTLVATSNTKIQSIKELVDAGLYYVPSIYIRPPNERPNLPCVMNPTTVCESVPVISLANVFGHDWDYIVGQVREACSNWGVFQVLYLVYALLLVVILDGGQFYSLITTNNL